ncbi:MAG: GNAT family N-acetyltransferase [Shouchella clausii]|jgi:acetyltransferase
MSVEIIKLDSVIPYIGQLAELMVETVDGGASIGFIAPMGKQEAEAYWHSLQLSEHTHVWVALADDSVIGTIQLHLVDKANGRHRAEIAKLMVANKARRQGIGRKLLTVAEETAMEQNRTLLILDTEEGAPSNVLYKTSGYTFAGTIPQFAENPYGGLRGTNLYYKHLKNGD